MNSLWLIASVSVALTALIAEPSFSLPLPQENQSTDSLEEVAQEVAQVGVEVPICYMETADARFLDLTGLCEEQGQQPTLHPNGIEAGRENVHS